MEQDYIVPDDESRIFESVSGTGASEDDLDIETSDMVKDAVSPTNPGSTASSTANSESDIFSPPELPQMTGERASSTDDSVETDSDFMNALFDPNNSRRNSVLSTSRSRSKSRSGSIMRSNPSSRSRTRRTSLVLWRPSPFLFVYQYLSSEPSIPNPSTPTWQDEIPQSFPWKEPASTAGDDWRWQKRNLDSSSQALDELMRMIGLENAKAWFVGVNTLRKFGERQNATATDNLSLTFIGNPGTGKTIVADLYAKFLYETNAIRHSKVVRTSGPDLISYGAFEISKVMSGLSRGGVLIVEAAHFLVSSGASAGNLKLEMLFSGLEKMEETVYIIFSGYGKRMQDLPMQHPAYTSFVPNAIRFADYKDRELLEILIRGLKTRFPQALEVKGGLYGIYMRIVARRIGRGRGKEGFGNAREVNNMVTRIIGRQADRLFQEMKSGQTPNERILTREDIVGPPPSITFENSKAWKRLNRMIGLQSVKDTIRALVHQLQINYNQELQELPLRQCSLNQLFLGNPGTGKTTVAKLYGQVLADIGMLSKGEVIVKTPSDFVGSVLGESEANTKAILNAAIGKVLIIDEAYGLAGNSTRDPKLQSADSYKTAVIDTLVAEVQSTPGEDRAVLLLGYKDRMEAMLEDTNSALARRFPVASAFVFEDFTREEMTDILDLKLEEQALRIDDNTRKVMLEVLERARCRPGFGNAGEIDILLDRAKLRQQTRLAKSETLERAEYLEANDVDENYDRASRDDGAIAALFDGFVGLQHLVDRLETYQRVVRKSRLLDIDPQESIPFNFIFCGPPGTGKTSTAKKMGEIFYEIGLLATTELLERSASDLIGEYIGHTGPKTKKLFKSALGRVLLIDEAYMLAQGQFGKEALTEMVNILTHDQFRNKLVVVLAGYESDINKLMTINQGLVSRFPEVVKFDYLSTKHCIDLLLQCLKAKGLDIIDLEGTRLLGPSLEACVEKLTLLPSWGNARDIQTLSKAIYMKMMGTPGDNTSMVVSAELVTIEINTMAEERRKRTSAARPSPRQTRPSGPTAMEDSRSSTLPPPPQLRPRTSALPKDNTPTVPGDVRQGISTARLRDTVRDKMKPTDSTQKESTAVGSKPTNGTDQIPRDAGVSDETWNQLQLDKEAARKRQESIQRLQKLVAAYEKQISDAQQMLDIGNRAKDWKGRLEYAQTKHNQCLSSVHDKLQDALEEEKMKGLLNGTCAWGYYWVRQDGGFRCAAGACFVSMQELKDKYFSNDGH